MVHSIGHLPKTNIVKAVRKVVGSCKRSKNLVRVGLGLVVKKARKESSPIVRSVIVARHGCHGRLQLLISFLLRRRVFPV